MESTFYPITIDFQSLATYGYIAFQIDFQDKRWINVALFQVTVAHIGEWRFFVILIPSVACKRVFAELCLSP